MIDFNRPAFVGSEMEYIQGCHSQRNALWGWHLYKEVLTVDGEGI